MLPRWAPVLLVVLPAAGLARAGDWPHWRGPTRDGHVEEASRWQAGWPPRLLWKAQVGEGSTSPLVVDGKVHVMGWGQGKDHLHSLDAVSGKVLWSVSYPSPRYARLATGDQGQYGGVTSTPEYDPATGLLYTLSADGFLAAWDTRQQGKRVWGLNLHDRYRVLQRPRVGTSGLRDYGFTSSPLVLGDTLVVEVGAREACVVGLDKATGEERWRSQVGQPAGHTGGPVPITVEGVPCVAVHAFEGLLVVRVDPGKEGQTVATYPWRTDFANNVAAPAVEGHHVILTSAYNHNKVARLEITLKGARKVWEREHASKVCSPVIHKGHVYWAWRTLVCLDLATGKLVWEQGGFSDPGSCIATTDDRLVIFSGRGNLTLVDTAARSPQRCQTLARLDPFFRTSAWPHLVLAGGRLFLKDRAGNLLCLSLMGE